MYKIKFIKDSKINPFNWNVIYNRFGSKIMGDRTNILYNNQMDDFSCPSGEFNSFSLPNYSINYVQPGKRPVSSMTPLIALDENKNTRLVCGSSGGTRIITSTALVSLPFSTLTNRSSHFILISLFNKDRCSKLVIW